MSLCADWSFSLNEHRLLLLQTFPEAKLRLVLEVGHLPRRRLYRPPFVSGSLESAFTYCQKKDKRRGRYRTKGQGKKRKFSGKKSPKGLKAWTGHRGHVVPVPVSYIFWLTWAVCPGTTSTKKQQLLFRTLVIFSGGTVVILFSGRLLPSVVTI